MGCAVIRSDVELVLHGLCPCTVRLNSKAIRVFRKRGRLSLLQVKPAYLDRGWRQWRSPGVVMANTCTVAALSLLVRAFKDSLKWKTINKLNEVGESDPHYNAGSLPAVDFAY